MQHVNLYSKLAIKSSSQPGGPARGPAAIEIYFIFSIMQPIYRIRRGASWLSFRVVISLAILHSVLAILGLGLESIGAWSSLGLEFGPWSRNLSDSRVAG